MLRAGWQPSPCAEHTRGRTDVSLVTEPPAGLAAAAWRRGRGFRSSHVSWKEPELPGARHGLRSSRHCLVGLVCEMKLSSAESTAEEWVESPRGLAQPCLGPWCKLELTWTEPPGCVTTCAALSKAVQGDVLQTL